MCYFYMGCNACTDDPLQYGSRTGRFKADQRRHSTEFSL